MKTPKPWEIVSFVTMKWDERYQRKISWIVHLVVTSTLWTYFVVGFDQYYIDSIDDLKILSFNK